MKQAPSLGYSDYVDVGDVPAVLGLAFPELDLDAALGFKIRGTLGGVAAVLGEPFRKDVLQDLPGPYEVRGVFGPQDRPQGGPVLLGPAAEGRDGDDLVDEMIACLKGEEHHCEFEGLDVIPSETGRYCYVPTTHKATLGEIVDLLKSFAAQPQTLMIPEIPSNSFAKKLYSTYLSYLPKEKVAFPLKMNVDDRGSFTELVHTLNCGQVSINISKPGITKGQHWHNTKWEFFIVVSGHGLIQERKLGTDEVIEFEVSGDNIQCIHMLPGYTHNIINLSETENLVTVMTCNEVFNPQRPDTFFEPV